MLGLIKTDDDTFAFALNGVDYTGWRALPDLLILQTADKERTVAVRHVRSKFYEVTGEGGQRLLVTLAADVAMAVALDHLTGVTRTDESKGVDRIGAHRLE